MALFRPEALAIATLPSTTTGIVSLEMPEPVASAEPVIYNLQGQRVGIPAKGVYIKNGKKYLTK